MRFCCVPGKDGLLVTSVYIATFLAILPLLCQRLGFSKYFIVPSESYKLLEAENEIRTKEAKDILQKFGEIRTGHILRSDIVKRTVHVDFSIVILTTRRYVNSHYLLQVAARLLPQVANDQGKSVITILNTDPQPELHEDATFLSDFVDVVNNSSHGIDYPGGVLAREKDDYVIGLETALLRNSTFLLMIQDDALPSRNLFNHIRFVLKYKLPWKFLKSRHDWAFLKLYYPEKWQGFGWPELPELLLASVLGGSLLTYVHSKIRRNLQSSLLSVFAVWSVYSFLVAYSVGRAHWLELRKLSPYTFSVVKAPGCCLPGVLYQRSHAVELIHFLKSVNCNHNYPVDVAIDDFANKKNLERYLLIPNLFSHIGLHSSLSTTRKDFREFYLLFKP